VKSVSFHAAASAEAEAAIRWYNARVAGLGDDFRAEVVRGVERIAETPLSSPTSAYDPRARRYLLVRFPYSIEYVVADDGAVIVAAIAHARRRPGYWTERVR
jgi:plasmid stabilization system protein ParE